jgi:hypothetical protein
LRMSKVAGPLSHARQWAICARGSRLDSHASDSVFPNVYAKRRLSPRFVRLTYRARSASLRTHCRHSSSNERRRIWATTWSWPHRTGPVVDDTRSVYRLHVPHGVARNKGWRPPHLLPGTSFGIWDAAAESTLMGVVPVTRVLSAFRRALATSQRADPELKVHQQHLEELVQQRAAEFVEAVTRLRRRMRPRVSLSQTRVMSCGLR